MSNSKFTINARNAVLLVVCGIFIFFNVWVWQEVVRFVSAPDVRVFFFDVGQGDATLIDSKDGRQILIDGGPSGAILTRLGSVMPFGDNSIDAIIISHPHADHISGLVSVLERYSVGVIFESGARYTSSEFRALEQAIDKKGVKRVYVDQPMTIFFGDDARLALVSPNDSFVGSNLKRIHDAMIVGFLEYKDARVLFMGDAEQKLEERLAKQNILPKIDILKAGHHGSKTSSSNYFLNTIKPQVAVLSVGKNKYGHPNDGVMERLNAFRIRIFRTDEDGTIEARFFDSQVFISSWRGEGKDIWERIR